MACIALIGLKAIGAPEAPAVSLPEEVIRQSPVARVAARGLVLPCLPETSDF